MKRIFKSRTLWGIILSAAFLTICFFRVDLSSVPGELSKINGLLLIPAFLCQFLNIFVRSQRWRIIIEPERKSDWLHTFSLYSIGAMLNLTFPALIGQVARTILFSKRYQITKTFTFTTILLEFLFDAISILIIVFVTSLIFVIFPDYLTIELLVIALIVLVFVLLNFILRRKGKIHILDEIPQDTLLGKIKARLAKIYHSFLNGLRMLRSSKHLALVSSLSLLSWTLNTFFVLFIVLAFNLKIPLWSAVLVVVINTLFVMIPLAPGNIGTLHFATTLALGILGVNREISFSVAIILHAINILPTYILGAFFLSTEHLTIKELRVKDEQAQAEILESFEEKKNKK